jgi:hypothetical protein
VAAVDGLFTAEAARLADLFGDALSGAARGILLVAVVQLEDLRMIIRPKDRRRQARQVEEQVDPTE